MQKKIRHLNVIKPKSGLVRFSHDVQSSNGLNYTAGNKKKITAPASNSQHRQQK